MLARLHDLPVVKWGAGGPIISMVGRKHLVVAGVTLASWFGAVGTSQAAPVSYWAHPASAGPIRAAPTGNSRQIARLHWVTEDGYAEVYPVLGSRVDARGQRWLYIGIPRRPNGTKGWVGASELGPIHRDDESIVINRETLMITLFRDGREVFSAPVGVGKPSTPTPPGRFWIREKLPGFGGDPIYGPLALGTSDYSVLTDWPGGGVVGIHGTNEPWLIPGRPSHGCVRLRNADITRLYHLVQIGTSVTIL